MITQIYYKGSWRNVESTVAPADSRMLEAFLIANTAPRCFYRVQGAWYKIHTTGLVTFAARTLSHLSLGEWLKLALTNN